MRRSAAAAALASALVLAACTASTTPYRDGGIVVTHGSRLLVVEPDGSPIAERQFEGDVRVLEVSRATGTMLLSVGGDGATAHAVTIDPYLREATGVGVMVNPSWWFRWRTLSADDKGTLRESPDGWLLFDGVDGSVTTNPTRSLWIGQRTVDGSWLIGDDLREPELIELFDPATGDLAEADLEWGDAAWASAVTGIASSQLAPLIGPSQRFALPVRRQDGAVSMVVHELDFSENEIVTLDPDGAVIGRFASAPVRYLGAHFAMTDPGDGVYRIIDPVTGEHLMTLTGAFTQTVAELGEQLLLLDRALLDVERRIEHTVDGPELVIDASPAGDRLVVFSRSSGETLIAPVHAPEQAQPIVTGVAVAWLDPDVFDDS